MRPEFSVLIPSYQRRDTLARVLDAYERQTPHDLLFEVVVVDDGSRDGTADMLAARPRSPRFPLRFVRQTNGGPAKARNRALQMARGEIILFTGDDIEPADDLLHQHLEGHRRLADVHCAVLGLTRWHPEAETTATMRHIDGVGAQQFSYHFMRDGAEYDFRHLYTSNVSLYRHLLDKEPDYFSTDFPAAAFEDAELGFRLAGHGLRIVYRVDAVAYHHHHYEAPGFFQRQKRCGEMASVLYRLRPELGHLLDLEILRDLASHLAASPASIASNAGRLEARQGDVLALARSYDPLPLRAVDRLLAPLFRYGYLRGLAEGLYPERLAKAMVPRLFAHLVEPAVDDFIATLKHHGLPCPSSAWSSAAAASR